MSNYIVIKLSEDAYRSIEYDPEVYGEIRICEEAVGNNPCLQLLVRLGVIFQLSRHKDKADYIRHNSWNGYVTIIENRWILRIDDDYLPF